MAWTSLKKFSMTDVRPIPSYIESTNKIIYETNYKPNTDSGIFEYDITTDTHKTIKSSDMMFYHPKGSVSIYNKTRNELIIAGGHDRYKKDYRFIRIHNMEGDTIKMFDGEMKFGIGPRLTLTNNDTHLHVTGGVSNTSHAIYDLQKRKIYDIKENVFNNKICNHALIYHKSGDQLIILGGIVHDFTTYFDSFRVFRLNRSKYLVYGYVKIFLNDNENNDIFKKYVFSLNDIILKFLGIYNNSHWEENKERRMKQKMGGFGWVLYDDRIIITFGGWIQNQPFASKCDEIYYLDLENKNGSWEESKLKCPKPGACNALIKDNKTVHIMPYFLYQDHYSIDIADILPSNLIK